MIDLRYCASTTDSLQGQGIWRHEGESTMDAAQELIGLQHDWMEAVKRRDLEFLEHLLAPEFSLITGRPGIETRTRQQYLDVTRDRYTLESFEYVDLDVHAYGDFGFTRSRYSQRGWMDDMKRDQAFLMTDVWVRRNGSWQAVSRHISPLDSAR
jgi:ketosteroid isomerase-like protein